MNFRHLCHTLLFFLFAVPAFSQNAHPILTADTAKIRFGEPVTLTLSMQYKAKGGYVNITWPQLPDSLPGGVYMTGQKPLDTLPIVKDDPGFTLRRQEFTVTAFDSGVFTAGPFAVVINGDSVFSNDISFSVLPMAVDTSKGIKDIKEITDVPYSLLDWLLDYKYYIIGGLLAIAAIITTIIYIRRRRKKRQTDPVIPPPVIIPAHELALKKLRQLKDDRSWLRNDLKLFYSDVTAIVREYIEERYKVPAMEQTSAELLHSLKHSSCPPAEKDRLAKVLTIADLVKFARQQPDELTALTSLDLAIEFVQHTTAVENEEKPANEKAE
jgi:hypothetical protein